MTEISEGSPRARWTSLATRPWRVGFTALSRNSTGGLFYGPFAGFTAFSIFAALAYVGRRPVPILGWQPRHRCGCVRFFPSSGLGTLLRYASIIESKT